MTRIAWFARIPYHGWVSSSRRSIVARNATQAPAVGPPRIIAAPTNGMWNVSVLPPGRPEDPERADEAVQEPQQEPAGRAARARLSAAIPGSMAAPRRARERGHGEQADVPGR